MVPVRFQYLLHHRGSSALGLILLPFRHLPISADSRRGLAVGGRESGLVEETIPKRVQQFLWSWLASPCVGRI